MFPTKQRRERKEGRKEGRKWGREEGKEERKVGKEGGKRKEKAKTEQGVKQVTSVLMESVNLEPEISLSVFLICLIQISQGQF